MLISCFHEMTPGFILNFAQKDVVKGLIFGEGLYFHVQQSTGTFIHLWYKICNVIILIIIIIINNNYINI